MQAVNNRQTIKAHYQPVIQRASVKDYIAYGVDNLYPQRLLELLTGTASLAVERKAQFIEGNGFADLDFYKTTINSNGETIDHLLSEVAQDLSQFKGFALLVNYNANFRPAKVSHIPFEKVRQGVPDDADYISKIFIINRIDRFSKSFGLKRTQAESFDVFNPNPGVVSKQMAAAGGIENYKGQILYAFHQKPGSRYYPPIIDEALKTDIEAELSIKKSRRRDIRHGYSAKTLITLFGEANPTDAIREKDAEDFKEFVGEEGSTIQIEYAQDENSASRIQTFSAPDASARYKTDEDAIKSAILDHFAIPTILYGREIAGKLGTSEEFEQAVKYVQRFVVNRDQRLIERTFSRLFSLWYKPINQSGNYGIENLTIEQVAVQTGDNQSQTSIQKAS